MEVTYWQADDRPEKHLRNLNGSSFLIFSQKLWNSTSSDFSESQHFWMMRIEWCVFESAYSVTNTEWFSHCKYCETVSPLTSSRTASLFTWEILVRRHVAKPRWNCYTKLLLVRMKGYLYWTESTVFDELQHDFAREKHILKWWICLRLAYFKMLINKARERIAEVVSYPWYFHLGVLNPPFFKKLALKLRIQKIHLYLIHPRREKKTI